MITEEILILSYIPGYLDSHLHNLTTIAATANTEAVIIIDKPVGFKSCSLTAIVKTEVSGFVYYSGISFSTGF